MKSNSDDHATANGPPITCDICFGMTIYSSAMRDAKKPPMCIGLHGENMEVDNEGLAKDLDKAGFDQSLAQSELEVASHPDMLNFMIEVQHMRAFSASITNRPFPLVNPALQDYVFVPKTDRFRQVVCLHLMSKSLFRYIFWGATVYISKPPSDDARMVLPLCQGYTWYLVKPKKSPAGQVTSEPLPPATSTLSKSQPDIPQVDILARAQTACSFTARAMITFTDRHLSNFPERYVHAMERLARGMYAQMENLAKLAHDFGSKRDP
ncbi:hypothetical protein LEN26_008713 [Aphanomyces euteiches]|nr:hypothetical protein AeMF1_019755 [Aphanomyces euteiches]KAH9130247.1 hypothetical protein LEN26_008713 [Aphanomyces euteiches]KAH9167739.1 hypothetical protein AeNC1_018088 [Aphanomyces euteiches]